jgi:hypothetical protein
MSSMAEGLNDLFLGSVIKITIGKGQGAGLVLILMNSHQSTVVGSSDGGIVTNLENVVNANIDALRLSTMNKTSRVALALHEGVGQRRMEHEVYTHVDGLVADDVARMKRIMMNCKEKTRQASERRIRRLATLGSISSG